MNADRRWPDAGDPSIPRRIRGLWRMSAAFVQPVGLCIPRGVRKYRSIEEADADRERWESERIQRLREERRKK